MDSEHRHELQENILARWLTEKLEAVKPHVPLILLGFIAAMVASYAWNSYRGSATTAEEAAWQSYSIAMDTGLSERTLIALEQVSTDNPGSAAVAWADITWADGKLMQASQQFLRNRSAANDAIADAEEKYNALLADTSLEGRILDRARFGLARLKDLQGEAAAAKELYEKVGGAFEEIAKERAEELASEQVQEDAAWLASAEAIPRQPQFGAASSQPDLKPDNLDLPADEPEVDGDGFMDLLKSYEGLEVAPEESADGDSEGEAPTDEPVADGESAGEGSSDEQAAAETDSAEGGEEMATEKTDESAPAESDATDTSGPESEAAEETAPAPAE